MVEGTKPADRPIVHVVTVALGDRASPAPVFCPTLPGDICIEIRDLAAKCRNPRDVAAHVRALCDEHKLGGLAVWYQPAKGIGTVPPPLGVPIEPLELDEARAPLHELPGLAGEWADPEALRTTRWKRTFMRLGLPVLILLQLLANVAMQVVADRRDVAVWLWVGVLGSLILAAVLVWWLSDHWLIVPSGVIIRKTLAGKVGKSLRLVTPADAVLLIRSQPQFHILELWVGRTVKKRKATKLETLALLAAWRSPLPPPSLDRLSDWL